MRLRQLGTTQSVTFIAPPEVNQCILDVCEKDAESHLDSADVVTWLLDRTCVNNRELQSMYFAQGTDFCNRMQAAASFKDFLTNATQRAFYLKVLQQPEQQTLEQLYKPQMAHDLNLPSSSATSLEPTAELFEFMKELKEMQRQSRVVHGSKCNSALEEVEQEREVAYEIEEEREVQRPRLMKALKFPGLHDSILNFVKGNDLVGNGFMKASTWLESTQLGLKYKIKASSFLPNLYVSTEFTKTIELNKGEVNDNFTVYFIPSIYYLQIP